MLRIRSLWLATAPMLCVLAATSASGQPGAAPVQMAARLPAADSGRLAGPASPAGPRWLRIAARPGEVLTVLVVGDGAPVVFVPGMVGAAYGYRHQVEGLADGTVQSIVVEPLGIGSSGRPPGADYSLTAQADRVAAVLDTLGVGPVVLVAHSVAGSMALRLAARRPEHVRAILLLESGVAEVAAGPSFRRAMKLAPVLKLLDVSELLTRYVARDLRAASGDSSWITPDVLAAYTDGPLEDQRAAIDAFAAIARAVEPESLSTRLSEIRVPVVVLVGSARHRSGPAAAELDLLRQRLGNVAVYPIPGAGHFLHEERPGLVTAAIRCLLEAAAAPSCVPDALVREDP